MSAYSAKTNCFDARPYYYDYLSEQTRDSIPNGALDHITRCADCRNDIDKLKKLVENPDDKHSSWQNQKDKAVIGLLSLHLAYAGKPVKCCTAKQFIASLADPILPIRVETPITRHVDECSACREDLLYLMDLQLNHSQLCRLGQLLAYIPATDKISCSHAHGVIESAASMEFNEINAEQLKHICTCPDCRDRLYRRREDIRKDLAQRETVESELSCESISTCDIFDFSVPYGIDPADENFKKSKEQLALHLRSCPRCLARIQSLHENIYNIAERPDSHVVSYFTLQEKGEPKLENTEGPDYAGIIPASAALKLKRKLSSLYLKRYARLAIVAAAIMIIYALLPGAPPAQALNPAIVRAIKLVDNVYIATYDPGRTEPRQEKWISRSLGVSLLKTGERLTFSSIPDRVKKTRNSQESELQVHPLTNSDIAKLQKTINGTLGIIPYDDMSNLSPDHEWTELIGEDVEEHVLTFSDNLDFNRVRFSRWHFFVDVETGRPNKVRIECRYSADEDYKLRSEFIIEYPDESEIKAAIESFTFGGDFISLSESLSAE